MFGSNFLLKVKAIRYVTYLETKKITVEKLKQYSISELKGE